MKFRFYILVVGLLVYMLELSVLSVYCKPISKAERSCSGNPKRGGCRKMENTPCKKLPTPNECNSSGCISNCPLFYAATLSDVSMPGKSINLIERKYPHFTSSYISTYYPSTWKPPNA